MVASVSGRVISFRHYIHKLQTNRPSTPHFSGVLGVNTLFRGLGNKTPGVLVCCILLRDKSGNVCLYVVGDQNSVSVSSLDILFLLQDHIKPSLLCVDDKE